MEDSLELPEDYDDFQVQNLLSPAPQNPDSKHTTPPHSLAYSNCNPVLSQPPAPKIE